MDQEVSSTQRPQGETTGTPRRPKQQLGEPILAYDLDKEADALIREALSVDDGRAAKSLAKVSRLHLVLTALRSGIVMRDHANPAPTCIQVIRGSIHVLTPNQAVHLTPGMVVTVESDIHHSVEATEDSAFLITFAVAQETRR